MAPGLGGHDVGLTEGLLKAAAALLDACAETNDGFFEENHQPEPEGECALYGAAGIAARSRQPDLISFRPRRTFLAAFPAGRAVVASGLKKLLGE